MILLGSTRRSELHLQRAGGPVDGLLRGVEGEAHQAAGPLRGEAHEAGPVSVREPAAALERPAARAARALEARVAAVAAGAVLEVVGAAARQPLARVLGPHVLGPQELVHGAAASCRCWVARSL